MYMEYIYFKTVDDDIVDNYELVRIAKIVDDLDIGVNDFEKVRKFAQWCDGIVEEINPSVKYLVKNGKKFTAIKVYHRRHPDMSLPECRREVEKIEAVLMNAKEN